MSTHPRSLPAHDAEFKPAPASIIIGTPETVTQLAGQMDAVGQCPAPVGCVLVGDAAAVRPGSIRTAGGHGLAILGSLDDLPRLQERLRIRGAIVTLPGTMPTIIARVRRTLADLGIEERFVAPLREALTIGLRTEGWWRPRSEQIDTGALIGRESHRLDRAEVGRVLRGKRVLITGAGGSIGSELARIAAGFDPEMLVLMERSENALFEIDRKLASTGVPVRAMLHDVVDSAGTARLLAETRPQVVFHAAAHKHVPLMEDHPAHAVTNNVFGTKSVADAAAACGAERFVLISTDKAVNPTSVMGATKRIAELYVRSLHGAGGGKTSFAVVRFGNVIGSACSVLPIWAAQLAEGGPITVTDPRMTRYFMTIPEAATLVAQAAALGSDVRDRASSAAALFVLDMGEPVRILDLARRFINQHGLQPIVCRGTDHAPLHDGQVEIVFTGIRPGEKLDEELAYADERLLPTRHPGIRALDAREDPVPNMVSIVRALDEARSEPDPAPVADALRAAVPCFEAAQLRAAG